MAGLGSNQVRVNVRGAGKGGRSLRYVRPLANLTFSEAVRKLGRMGDENELPELFMEPYYLNGKQTDEDSEVILKAGDTISLTDP